MSKIIITETIFKDGETPLCFDCQKPAVGMQIKCNCGCDELWCQPCYYKHYSTFANARTLKRFLDPGCGVCEKLAQALTEP